MTGFDKLVSKIRNRKKSGFRSLMELAKHADYMNRPNKHNKKASSKKIKQLILGKEYAK